MAPPWPTGRPPKPQSSWDRRWYSLPSRSGTIPARLLGFADGRAGLRPPPFLRCAEVVRRGRNSALPWVGILFCGSCLIVLAKGKAGRGALIPESTPLWYLCLRASLAPADGWLAKVRRMTQAQPTHQPETDLPTTRKRTEAGGSSTPLLSPPYTLAGQSVKWKSTPLLSLRRSNLSKIGIINYPALFSRFPWQRLRVAAPSAPGKATCTPLAG